jgi:hypothetical protein
VLVLDALNEHLLAHLGGAYPLSISIGGGGARWRDDSWADSDQWPLAGS